jgi:hypothetical protein
MAGKSKNDDYDGVTVSFGAKFARSDQFKTVFREGMPISTATGVKRPASCGRLIPWLTPQKACDSPRG